MSTQYDRRPVRYDFMVADFVRPRSPRYAIQLHNDSTVTGKGESRPEKAAKVL
jgi:hypothetical protein